MSYEEAPSAVQATYTYPPTKNNIDHLEQWFWEKYISSTFNICNNTGGSKCDISGLVNKDFSQSLIRKIFG